MINMCIFTFCVELQIVIEATSCLFESIYCSHDLSLIKNCPDCFNFWKMNIYHYTFRVTCQRVSKL